MSTKIGIFFLIGAYLWISLWASLGLAHQKPVIKYPPLSIVLEALSQEPFFIPDPANYLKFLDSHVLDSLLSPKELWEVQKQRAVTIANIQIITHFYNWYFSHLPSLIPAYKKNQQGSARVISEEDLSEVNFLFKPNAPVSAQNIIRIAKKYNYTTAEKLNLFFVSLHKNISDKELLKVLKAWKITTNKAVYISDYSLYLNNFFQQYLPVNEETKQHTLSVLQTHKAPLTSLLHEFFNANRKALFKAGLQKSQKTVNLSNYLSQTVGHLATFTNWSKGEFYLSLLVQHPFIDWNKKDFKGRTPLFYAVFGSEDHFFPGVKLLLKQPGIKLDVLDDDRKSPAFISREINKPNIAQFLHTNGVPWTSYFSLQNSYMDEKYNIIRVDYQATIDLNNLVRPFNWNPLRPSWKDFNTMDVEAINLPSHEIWNQFQYYFLLNVLLSMLQQEEIARHKHIVSLLLDEGNKKDKVGQWIRAIYRGDKTQLKKLFSDQDSSFLQKPLFYIQHDLIKPYNQSALLQFNLLERAKVQGYFKDQNKLSFYMPVSSLLDEAIRANQIESVYFFLSEGVDPTQNRPNILIRNSLMTALLVGDLLLTDPNNHKEHLKTLDLLMSHPLVNKDFLNQEIIPGLTYPALAGLKGHLPALKKAYEKGAKVSKDTILWDTGMLIRDIIFTLGFFKTAEFIFKDYLKENAQDTNIKNHFKACQMAFH